jgi:uncharacterized membrane protein
MLSKNRTARHIACTGGLITALMFGLSGVMGCGSGDLPLDQVDPGAVPADPSFDMVFSIIQRECTPCHNDGGEDDEEDADRRASAGNGDNPNYETCEGVIDNLDNLYSEVFVRNTMPPGAWPRLTSEEKLIIQRWLDNGAEAPCLRTGN